MLAAMKNVNVALGVHRNARRFDQVLFGGQLEEIGDCSVIQRRDRFGDLSAGKTWQKTEPQDRSDMMQNAASHKAPLRMRHSIITSPF
jgi:hypothetical protein